MSGHRQAGGGSETSAQNAVFRWSTFPVIFERPTTKQKKKPSSITREHEKVLNLTSISKKFSRILKASILSKSSKYYVHH